MSRHSSVAFNHSCLKVPINPLNKLPAPTFEQKRSNQLKNQFIRLNSDTNETHTEDRRMKSTKRNKNESLKSLIDFYDSIPDYSDVNHLSNQEFYRKLENLKVKQKNIYEYLETEVDIEDKSGLMDHYEKQAVGDPVKKPRTIKNSNPRKLNIPRKTPETESVSSYGKETPVAPPSRRSVRIESPRSDSDSKSSHNDQNSPDSESKSTKTARCVSSASSKNSRNYLCSEIDNMWDDFSVKDFYKSEDGININLDNGSPLETRSVPNSPVKTKPSVVWKDCGITIPKPFKMTVRDEEDRIVDEIILKNKKPKRCKSEMFRAHPVPVESQIPLFDKIMENNEIRREIVKKRSKEALKAQMKPFSFTRREEEIQHLTRRLSKSSPQLTFDEPPLKIKHFKAKPIPKNLFSNYIYKKMHEDEFYRALKKKIRAEEMLKASSLPPSMAARERVCRKTNICPRGLRDMELDLENDTDAKSSKTGSRLSKRHERLDLEFDDLQSDFMFNSPRRCKYSKGKRAKSAKKCPRANDFDLADNKRAQSALELQSVNRSNLAAVLRIQSARLTSVSTILTPRKRMEIDMCKKLEEQKLKEESRWREKVMRQKPVWEILNYSHEEDLAMRLQLRRDEERLRQEEHQHHMELMLGRVQQIPTLFERQSHFKDPKTRQELMQTLCNEIGNYSSASSPSGTDKNKPTYKDDKNEEDEDNVDD